MNVPPADNAARSFCPANRRKHFLCVQCVLQWRAVNITRSLQTTFPSKSIFALHIIRLLSIDRNDGNSIWTHFPRCMNSFGGFFKIRNNSIKMFKFLKIEFVELIFNFLPFFKIFWFENLKLVDLNF